MNKPYIKKEIRNKEGHDKILYSPFLLNKILTRKRQELLPLFNKDGKLDLSSGIFHSDKIGNISNSRKLLIKRLKLTNNIKRKSPSQKLLINLNTNTSKDPSSKDSAISLKSLYKLPNYCPSNIYKRSKINILYNMNRRMAPKYDNRICLENKYIQGKLLIKGTGYSQENLLFHIESNNKYINKNNKENKDKKFLSQKGGELQFCKPIVRYYRRRIGHDSNKSYNDKNSSKSSKIFSTMDYNLNDIILDSNEDNDYLFLPKIKSKKIFCNIEKNPSSNSKYSFNLLK